MKIEWLNDALTEARVTRGVLWWKRVAHVAWRTYPERAGSWRHVASDREITHPLRTKIIDAQNAERSRRRVEGFESDWLPVSTVPRAKVVRR